MMFSCMVTRLGSESKNLKEVQRDRGNATYMSAMLPSRLAPTNIPII